MWAAIQSDLLDFVATIKEDTAKVISQASGEVNEEDEILSMRRKLIQDVKRSFDTYGTPIEDVHSKEFEKYMRQFSLSSQASDIAQLLDDEPDVSRHYAELVPIQISPELFWARYFFRLLLVSRGGVVNLDEDEEEELPWESSVSDAQSPISSSSTSNGNKINNAENHELLTRLKQLEEENAQLKGHVKVLVSRINELESRGEPDAISSAHEQAAESTILPLPLQVPALDDGGSPSDAPGGRSVLVEPPPAIVTQPVVPEQLAGLDEDEDENWG